jgi:hypothetical protein
MVSRYDIMKNSTELDPLTKEVYPDILSADFTSFVYKSPPLQFQASALFKIRPYEFTAPIYGVAALDDVLLNINNVAYITDVDSDKLIYFPIKSDMFAFIRTQ